MSSRSQVRELLEAPGFGSLYATRLVSAVADGVFQAALASYVFFNPENAATPAKGALAFAVLLLPYSIVGPFAGVFLDRWRRQRVLVIGNAVKIAFVVAVAALVFVHGSTGSAGSGAFAAAFVITTIAALGVNRFFLSALSAGLPHVIDGPRLIAANALSTTSGSIATIVGAAIGGGLRVAAGGGAATVASITLLAALLYAASASIAATRIGAGRLGPTDLPDDPPLSAVRLVGADLRSAIGYTLRRRRAALALATISAHRFLYGMVTLTIVLLYRNYFDGTDDVGASILGLGAVLGATGVGIFTAAAITPTATRRLGKRRWIIVLLIASGIALAVCGLPFQRLPLVLGAFVLGVAAQGVKICVDTTVQEEVDDAFRGRVFAAYDMAFNATYVAAAMVAALVLPNSGKSPPTMAALAIGYLVLAVAFAAASRASGDAPADSQTGVPVTLKSEAESAVVPR